MKSLTLQQWEDQKKKKRDRANQSTENIHIVSKEKLHPSTFTQNIYVRKRKEPGNFLLLIQ
jgi:hypothetical protein